jgi:hypothetical protein
MASVKEIAKAAKSKIKSQKKLKDEALDIVKDLLPGNCSKLLTVIMKVFKVDNDLNDLSDELNELTPNLYFRINTDSSKYEESIKNFQTDENPGLLTDGIILGDIYYRRENLLTPLLFKKIAKDKEGQERKIAEMFGEQTHFEGTFIRISVHFAGKLDVNNLENHIPELDKKTKDIIFFGKIKEKELKKALLKITWNWTIHTFGELGSSTPYRKINKFKKYKDMMTDLTKFLVKDLSNEDRKIKKYFGFLSGNVKIDFAQDVVYFDNKGDELEIKNTSKNPI